MNHKIKYVKTNFKNSVKNWKWSFKSNIKAIRNFLSPKNTINKGLTRNLSHVKHLFFHVNYINFNIKYYDCICRKCFSKIQNIQKDLIVLPDDTLHLNRSNNGFYFSNQQSLTEMDCRRQFQREMKYSILECLFSPLSFIFCYLIFIKRLDGNTISVHGLLLFEKICNNFCICSLKLIFS